MNKKWINAVDKWKVDFFLLVLDYGFLGNFFVYFNPLFRFLLSSRQSIYQSNKLFVNINTEMNIIISCLHVDNDVEDDNFFFFRSKHFDMDFRYFIYGNRFPSWIHCFGYWLLIDDDVGNTTLSDQWKSGKDFVHLIVHFILIRIFTFQNGCRLDDASSFFDVNYYYYFFSFGLVFLIDWLDMNDFLFSEWLSVLWMIWKVWVVSLLLVVHYRETKQKTNQFSHHHEFFLRVFDWFWLDWWRGGRIHVFCHNHHHHSVNKLGLNNDINVDWIDWTIKSLLTITSIECEKGIIIILVYITI